MGNILKCLKVITYKNAYLTYLESLTLTIQEYNIPSALIRREILISIKVIRKHFSLALTVLDIFIKC